MYVPGSLERLVVTCHWLGMLALVHVMATWFTSYALIDRCASQEP